MKAKKRILILSLLLVLALLFLIWFASDPLRQAKLLVALDRQGLEAAAQSCLAGDAGIRTYRGLSISIWKGTPSMVEFYMGGSGLVPSSRYWGLYYSPEDVPALFERPSQRPSPAGTDTWTWRGEGDNGGRTIRLAPCWFFYEAWF